MLLQKQHISVCVCVCILIMRAKKESKFDLANKTAKKILISETNQGLGNFTSKNEMGREVSD